MQKSGPFNHILPSVGGGQPLLNSPSWKLQSIVGGVGVGQSGSGGPGSLGVQLLNRDSHGSMSNSTGNHRHGPRDGGEQSFFTYCFIVDCSASRLGPL